MRFFKNLMLVFLGIALAVGILCAVVGIGSSINKITFGEQITEWFGSIGSKTNEIVDSIPKK